ncbi:ribonucleotide reductase small subunit, putative [Babesia caballi]|uniref:Ribonucleotide reductase small subunit, putative n=1 Tax=Babesia caballi TaxID=5871 RepID=A0AAV4M4C7_BABCB|nr:ribonucleotide reductase small subunit, putative [Babesia caballi]
MYKEIENNFWAAENFRFANDSEGIAGFDPELRQCMVKLLGYHNKLDHSEAARPAAVTLDLLADTQLPEARAFYGFQVSYENIHSEVFGSMSIAVPGSCEVAEVGPRARARKRCAGQRQDRVAVRQVRLCRVLLPEGGSSVHFQVRVPVRLRRDERLPAEGGYIADLRVGNGGGGHGRGDPPEVRGGGAGAPEAAAVARGAASAAERGCGAGAGLLPERAPAGPHGTVRGCALAVREEQREPVPSGGGAGRGAPSGRGVRVAAAHDGQRDRVRGAGAAEQAQGYPRGGGDHRRNQLRRGLLSRRSVRNLRWPVDGPARASPRQLCNFVLVHIQGPRGVLCMMGLSAVDDGVSVLEHQLSEPSDGGGVFDGGDTGEVLVEPSFDPVVEDDSIFPVRLVGDAEGVVPSLLDLKIVNSRHGGRHVP